jgi:hypothetical protein
MSKLPKNAFFGAVTGAAIIAASGIAQAEPIKPVCQWDTNAFGQYPLQYPQDCRLKEYDSKPVKHTGGDYTS